MNINLKLVDENNWEDCLKLRLSEEQKKFIAPNHYTILESRFYPEECIAYAVYGDDKLIGLTMYDKEDEIEISRLMFDIDYQGKGYGKIVIEKMLEIIKEKESFDKVIICAVPNNKNAISLYKKMNFIETGNIVNGEIEFVYNL